ncbi:MAG: type II toxin-antitoxin system RelE/ParE family toxin [Flavobacteriaceae bacterium]
MKFKVLFLKEAQDDFAESRNWYRKINPSLSARFTKDFKETIKSIQENPNKYQIRYDNNRVRLLRKFPYLIHYSIENDIVLIKALFHTSRDHRNWKIRNNNQNE